LFGEFDAEWTLRDGGDESVAAPRHGFDERW
jgi:hypothetical protein